MNGYYVVDPGGSVRPAADVLEWGWWTKASYGKPFEDGGRRVARDELESGVQVSTVFLGLDHNHSRTGPPVLFETALHNGGILHTSCQGCTSIRNRTRPN